MPRTTHAELTFQILRHVTEILSEGDVCSALALGFRASQIAQLERLTLRDLHRLSRAPTHFLSITVDPTRFDRLLSHVERGKQRESLQDELIRLRAPAVMMRTYFGMTNADYATRRRLLGLTGTGIGRPCLPSNADQERIWKCWQDHSRIPLEERYLEVGRATGVPLKDVWGLIRSWEADGLLPAQALGRQAKVVPFKAGR
jgi:hypothetical protein